MNIKKINQNRFPVTTWVDEVTWNDLERVKESSEMSISYIVREAIRQFLEKNS